MVWWALFLYFFTILLKFLFKKKLPAGIRSSSMQLGIGSRRLLSIWLAVFCVRLVASHSSDHMLSWTMMSPESKLWYIQEFIPFLSDFYFLSVTDMHWNQSNQWTTSNMIRERIDGCAHYSCREDIGKELKVLPSFIMQYTHFQRHLLIIILNSCELQCWILRSIRCSDLRSGRLQWVLQSTVFFSFFLFLESQ